MNSSNTPQRGYLPVDRGLEHVATLVPQTVKRKPVASSKKPVTETYTSVAEEHLTNAWSDDPDQKPPAAGGWQPLISRRRILSIFVMLHLGLIAGLQVLSSYSHQHQGLVTTDITRYYLWTYGPTAAFTLIAAFWNRLDYRIRQMAPWINMSRGRYATATRSLLLDYLSPIPPVILYKAAVSQDWIVALSSASLLLYTLLTILSTGLFLLTPVPVNIGSVTFTATRKFNDTWAPDFEINYLPIYKLVAIDSLGLNYPAGTTPDLAYQPFDTDAVSEAAIKQAYVDVMQFPLECEEAELIVYNYSYSWRWSGSFDICYTQPTTSSPNVNASISLKIDGCELVLDPSEVPLSYKSLSSGGPQYFAQSTGRICKENADDVRIGLRIGQGEMNPDVGPFLPNCSSDAPLANVKILKSKSWICRPDVWITKGTVRFNTTTRELGALPEISPDPDASRIPLKGINMGQFTANVDVGTQQQDTNGIHFQDPRPLPLSLPDGVSAHIDLALRGHTELTAEDLLSGDYFRDLWTATYRKYLVQDFTSSSIRSIPDQTPVTGTALVNRRRLLIQDLPVHLMQSILGLQILLMFFMLSRRNVSGIPIDPSVLARQISVLAESHNLRKMLSGHSLSRDGTLQGALSDTKFSLSADGMSITTDHDSIQFSQDSPLKNAEPDATQPSTSLAKNSQWWRPLAVRSTTKAFVMVGVLAIIVTIQILLHYSEQHGGICDISNSRYVSLLWSVVPASIMVSVHLYIGSLCWYYKTVMPYWHLRKGVRANQVLRTNYPALMEVEVLMLSLRRKEASLALLSISTILSAFLTIIISGVFSAELNPGSEVVDILPSTTFNSVGSSDNGSTGNNGIISSLILQTNLSYPIWTYENLVFPNLTFDKSAVLKASQGSLRVSVPVIRSALNCSTYFDADLSDITYTGNPYDPNANLYGMYLPGPAGCAGSNRTYVTTTTTNSSWIGFSQDDTVGCPQLNYIWGYSDETMNPSYVVALRCYEVIERVDVNATFSLPSFQLDPSSPPVPLEETATLFSGSVLPVPYRLMPTLSDSINGVSGMIFPVISAIVTRYNLTEIPYTSSLSNSILELNDTSKTNYISDAIQTIHGIIRAQQYSTALRQEAETSTIVPLKGTFINTNRLRLMQHSVSTHVLTAVLGFVLLSALLGTVLTSTKYTLPINPCSVAAALSMFADSNLFKRGKERLLSDIQHLSEKQSHSKEALNNMYLMLRRKRAPGRSQGVVSEDKWLFAVDVVSGVEEELEVMGGVSMR